MMRVATIPTKNPQIVLVLHVTELEPDFSVPDGPSPGDVFVQFSFVNLQGGQSPIHQITLSSDSHDKLLETLLIPKSETH